jgi:hypothetical protein
VSFSPKCSAIRQNDSLSTAPNPGSLGVSAPATLGGHPIDRVVAATASAPEGGGDKDRMVYMLVNDDFSAGQVGEGKANRPLMFMAAFLINAAPDFVLPRRRAKSNSHFWPIGRSLFDMIAANGGRISYIVLADGLSRRQSQAGKKAIFDLMGLEKRGGWLTNEARR